MFEAGVIAEVVAIFSVAQRISSIAVLIALERWIVFKRPCLWVGRQPSGSISWPIHLLTHSVGTPTLPLEAVSHTPRMIAISPRAISWWTPSMGLQSFSRRIRARATSLKLIKDPASLISSFSCSTSFIRSSTRFWSMSIGAKSCPFGVSRCTRLASCSIALCLPILLRSIGRTRLSIAKPTYVIKRARGVESP